MQITTKVCVYIMCHMHVSSLVNKTDKYLAIIN